MSTSSSIPDVLWIAIISLVVFSLFHSIAGFSNPLQFISLAVNIILIIGLYRLQKWAFVLAILASLFAPVVLFSRGDIPFYIGLLLNLSVLVPVLLCTKAFLTNTIQKPVTDA
jgi:hypothetical protein